MAVLFNVLSYGENMVCLNRSCLPSEQPWTIHAEDAAIRKLPTLSKKRPKKIDLLVIRTSKTGVLGISKPCENCVMLLQHQLPEKGYRLQKIYYSEDGEIKVTTLRKLLTEDPHITRYCKERSTTTI
jgi:cytidine deaminase